MNEQFNPGDFSQYGTTTNLDPNTGTNAWYAFDDTAGLTTDYFVTPGGVLSKTRGGTIVSFGDYTLAGAGDGLSVSFIARSPAIVNASTSFRIGFSSANNQTENIDGFATGSALGVQLGAGTNTGARWAESPDGLRVSGQSGTVFTNFDADGFGITESFQTIEFRMVRDALGGLALSVIGGGNELDVLNIGAADVIDNNYTFSDFFVYGSNALPYEIDNVTVSVIPEPGVVGLLAGAMALGVVATRRRRI